VHVKFTGRRKLTFFPFFFVRLAQKNSNFPTISHGTPEEYRPNIGYDVELVTRHTRGKEQVDSGSMHEKIGVGKELRVLCFGDSNYRPSEVTHAGAMV
jgi:hypothetical protein